MIHTGNCVLNFDLSFLGSGNKTISKADANTHAITKKSSESFSKREWNLKKKTQMKQLTS